MSAALLAMLPLIVALPPQATAPAPGVLPAGAHVTALDPTLGLVAVDLPRAGANAALVRLRHSSGIRFVVVQTGGGALAADSNCAVGLPASPPTGQAPTWWRRAIDLPSGASAPGWWIGIADSGVDVARLGTRDQAKTANFSGRGGATDVSDDIGHGTYVASLLAANRASIGVRGVVPDADLAVAKIARLGKCSSTAIQRGLIKAFAWLRAQDVQVVNVSATFAPNRALRLSLRSLQLSGALVVAAVGNRATPRGQTFPAGEPGVLAVGSLQSPKVVDGISTRAPYLDLVAPAPGLGVISSSLRSPDAETSQTPTGSSFATPLVAGAATLVWARHPTWRADRVAAALRDSAIPLGKGAPSPVWGYGRLDVAAAMKNRPPADRDEPNGWMGAAIEQGAIVTPSHRRARLAARIGGAKDRIDAYALRLGAGQQVRLRATSAAHGLKVQLVRPGAPGSLLDPPIASVAGRLRHWRAGRAGGASARARAGRAGVYVAVVIAPDALRRSVAYTLIVT